MKNWELLGPQLPTPQCCMTPVWRERQGDLWRMRTPCASHPTCWTPCPCLAHPLEGTAPATAAPIAVMGCWCKVLHQREREKWATETSHLSCDARRRTWGVKGHMCWFWRRKDQDCHSQVLVAGLLNIEILWGTPWFSKLQNWCKCGCKLNAQTLY